MLETGRTTNNHTRMTTIKADCTRLSADALIAKASYVVGMMTDNVNFPTPTPTLTEVSDAREALEAAVTLAERRAPADIALRNEKAVALRTLLVNLARYVNSVCMGDLNKALTSGFPQSKRPEPRTTLKAPADLDIRVSDFRGAVELKWKGSEEARMYQVYMHAGDISDPKGWTMVTVSSKTRTRIMDLEPGKYYSFYVTALGRAGEGPASDIVSGRAA